MATTSNSYTGNNSTVDYSFTFPYLNASDIKVSLDNVVKTVTTHYTLHNATTIRFGTAPGQGVAIKIYRDTASANLAATFYPGSAIRSSDLNDNYTQNLYVTQEAENDANTALDNSRVLEGSAYVSAISKATTAISTANTASTNATNAVTTANTASTNASSAVSTANTASTNASNAVTTANTASTNASNAVTTANTASTNATTAINTANSATTTANTASTNASNAVTTANAADTIADTAKLATDRLVATTSDGGNTWTLTGTNTNASTDPKGVGYAVAQAEAAVTTANAASTSVANSAIYQVVANYAALPTISGSNDGDFYQVNDSSAISRTSGTFSPNLIADPSSLAPQDFVGDDELTVKVRANNTSGKWDWQEYYSNDPESRYRKKLCVETKQTISENYTIPANNNALSVGPVAIAAGYVYTVPANSLYLVN